MVSLSPSGPVAVIALCVILCVLGLSVSDRVLEKTSLREKMAKYQAAVSKQGPTHSVSPRSSSFSLLLMQQLDKNTDDDVSRWN